MDNFQAVATLAKFIDQYEIFKDETLARKTGKAKQYWMQSSQMIDLYLALHSWIKINDVNILSYTLFELCPFFSNQQSKLRKVDDILLFGID